MRIKRLGEVTMRLDSAFSSALAGMMRSRNSLAERGHRIANATNGTLQQLESPETAPKGESVDLATELVGMNVDKRSFQANSRTISMTSELFAEIIKLGK